MDDLVEVENVVATWWRWDFRHIAQFSLGIISWLLPGPVELNRTRVHKFFKRHRETPDQFVFDGSNFEYFEQMLGSLFEMAKDRHIIDLGAGEGALHEFIGRMEIPASSYTGVELVPSPADVLSANILCEDFYNDGLSDLLNRKSLLVAVNTLCYVAILKEVPVLALGPLHRGTRLIVIEPWPGLFWDQHFGGVRPRYRKPEQLTDELGALAWRLSVLTRSHMLKIGRHYLFPLSYAACFVPLSESAVGSPRC